MKKAKEGCKLANFTLAHELGHLALDHHGRGAVTKNFQLFEGPNGMSNIPPTKEELEANYAAVFFQCGVSIFQSGETPRQLADRAYSDVLYVEKAKKIAMVREFIRELQRLNTPRSRVIL